MLTAQILKMNFNGAVFALSFIFNFAFNKIVSAKIETVGRVGQRLYEHHYNIEVRHVPAHVGIPKKRAVNTIWILLRLIAARFAEQAFLQDLPW